MGTINDYRKAFWNEVAKEFNNLAKSELNQAFIAKDPSPSGLHITTKDRTVVMSIHFDHTDWNDKFAILNSRFKLLSYLDQRNDTKMIAQRLVYLIQIENKKTSSLREQVIKLAHANPELRKELLPLLKEAKKIDRYYMEGKYFVGDDYFEDFKTEAEMKATRKEIIKKHRNEIDPKSLVMFIEYEDGNTKIIKKTSRKNVNQYFIEGQYQQQYGGGEYFEAFDTEREMRKEFKDIVRKPGHYEIEPRTLVMYVEFEDGSTKVIR